MSPVVATLILILIAVAAAAALYLWLVAWQGGVTANVGQPSAQTTVTIGGSTSVYPFTQLAVTQFQQNQTNIAISLNQGGSGAGMLAVCAKNVDIGEASALETVAQLQQPISIGGYGCPQAPAPVITTVAYDAVDVLVPTANAHGLVSMSADTLFTLYQTVGGASASHPGGYAFPQANGQVGAQIPAFVAGTPALWNQIPACVNLQANCNGATTQGVDTHAPAVVAAGGAPCGNDICDVGSATGSPCGFVVCAGGTVASPATNPVQAWTRSDNSGTTQTFTARLLGIGDGAGTTAGLGFSGCSPDGQLSSSGCGLVIPAATQANGNPGVIAGVASHPDAIGYGSDGLARVGSSGVAIVPFAAVGQTVAVLPTTGSSGTIASGILSSGTAAQQYQGWRPFEFVTIGAPSGEVQRFVQFVLQPQNNINFAAESAEVSIYSI